MGGGTVRETLGQFVKRKREAIGLSQRGLSKKAKISPSTVGRLEADEIKPGGATMEKLADALEVPLSQLTDAMQGRMTAGDKHPLVAKYDALPPKARRLVDRLVDAVAAEYQG